MPSFFEDPDRRAPLDENLYSLDEEERAFYEGQTGIKDEDELKKHILNVQAKAYNIYGYPCIRNFSFTKLKISRLPAYKQVLQLPHERENAILLDIGCCFGNDLRKAVSDGWPIQNVIGSDLRQGFWDCGHDLFKTNPETYPAKFIAGDAFDPQFIAPHSPFYTIDDVKTPRPDLKMLDSLTPLQGHISAIHASSFFHLFNEEKQLELAHLLASLLSPLPGSTIFGSHGGAPQKGFRTSRLYAPHQMFCHDPESWKDVWDGQVFKEGTVRVDAKSVMIKRIDVGDKSSSEVALLVWSVTRM